MAKTEEEVKAVIGDLIEHNADITRQTLLVMVGLSMNIVHEGFDQKSMPTGYGSRMMAEALYKAVTRIREREGGEHLFNEADIEECLKDVGEALVRAITAIQNGLGGRPWAEA